MQAWMANISLSHIVEFDPETGERAAVHGGRGYAADSGWSRGTAWALYGMSLAYRYTGYDRYLQAAKRVAHYFIANLPEDSVPYWDFRLPSDVAHSAIRRRAHARLRGCCCCRGLSGKRSVHCTARPDNGFFARCTKITALGKERMRKV